LNNPSARAAAVRLRWLDAAVAATDGHQRLLRSGLFITSPGKNASRTTAGTVAPERENPPAVPKPLMPVFTTSTGFCATLFRFSSS
jgi:hypothetical protein